MGNRLEGKKALITGASSGIGKEIALSFAREGADVCLGARRAEALSDVTNQCRALGINAIDVPTDITDKAQVRKMVQKCLAAFGKVDILVNNAG